MIGETFDRMYLFVQRLNESLNAKLITSTMMQTYALVVIDVFKIVLLATKYAQAGNSMSLCSTDRRIILEIHV
jgi:hypothetical protein